MRGLRRTLTGVAASVAAVALMGTGSALAASITVSSGAFTYTAASAEANHVTFWFDQTYGVFVIEDTGVSGISVGGQSAKGCHSYTAQIAYCDYGTIASITARVGNGGSFAQSNLSLTPVTMYAGSGDDTLIGGGGVTTLNAAAGKDTLAAGSGNTRLVGGTGTTTMTGGSGRNTYVGGSGADTINARNGVAEDVSCAAGTDKATVDASDIATADCETVDRGSTAIVHPGTDGSGTTSLAPGIGDELVPFKAPAPAISTAPVTLTKANEVPIRVGCPAAAAGGCEGSITLSLVDDSGAAKTARRAKRRLISKVKRFKIKAGKKIVVPVVLSRRGGRAVRRSLRKRNSLKLVVTVAMRSEAGTHTISKKISVHSARRAGSKAKPGKKRRR
jgi:hypothetical protein